MKGALRLCPGLHSNQDRRQKPKVRGRQRFRFLREEGRSRTAWMDHFRAFVDDLERERGVLWGICQHPARWTLGLEQLKSRHSGHHAPWVPGVCLSPVLQGWTLAFALSHNPRRPPPPVLQGLN